MDILRINTSDHTKIVINPQEVYLDVIREHAEVGLKNIIIVSYKNHLDRFCVNGKYFI
jgi:3-methyladenine DNA glycosylase Mpg